MLGAKEVTNANEKQRRSDVDYVGFHFCLKCAKKTEAEELFDLGGYRCLTCDHFTRVPTDTLNRRL